MTELLLRHLCATEGELHGEDDNASGLRTPAILVGQTESPRTGCACFLGRWDDGYSGGEGIEEPEELGQTKTWLMQNFMETAGTRECIDGRFEIP